MPMAPIARREAVDTVRSRRFLLYLALLLLPVVGGGWFAWEFHDNPEAVQAMTERFLPEPLTELSPEIAMMAYFDFLMFSIILIAVLHAARFVAGERETGTLQLVFTRPVHRRELVVGKFSAFLAIFIPLMVASILGMVIVLMFIGVGRPGFAVIGGYVAVTLVFTLVYAAIATLFSTLATRSTTAALGGFLFMILWVIVDFLTIYMPAEVADVLQQIALSHHANTILGYLTDGDAAIFAAGGIPENPGTVAAGGAVAAVIIAAAIPLALATVAIERIELK